MRSWAHGDPEAVVRTILASAPYRRAAPVVLGRPHSSWLQVLWQWFYDRVLVPIGHALFGPIGHSLSSVVGVGTVLGYGVVAVACAVLALAIYRLVVAFAGPARSRAGEEDRGGILLPYAASSAQWRARAAEAARAGEYARAVAALFTASLATLDERELVAFDATRTPGEYRRLVRRARATAAEPFNDLSARFVRAAYAGVITTAGDYAGAQSAYASFEPATAVTTAPG